MIPKRFYRAVFPAGVAICLLIPVTTARAHLMVEQHGTVNFANGGAFLVLSIPVSAFDGVDDDGDGALSAQELSRHTAEVERQINDGVQLLDDSGKPLPLQGLLMSLTPPDNAPSAPARHLVAMGRFPVDDAMSSPVLRVTLQGEAPDEQHFSITATRDGLSHVMEFSSDREFQALAK